MKRYNFDRYRGKVLMAQGIAVHADSLDDATFKALSLRDRKTERIEFVDNKPCTKYEHCTICSAEKLKERE